jgi:hypothetical protein
VTSLQEIDDRPKWLKPNGEKPRERGWGNARGWRLWYPPSNGGPSTATGKARKRAWKKADTADRRVSHMNGPVRMVSELAVRRARRRTRNAVR